jgi:hypothetical protein
MVKRKMATQKTRPKITVDKIKLCILIYALTTLGLVFVTHNGMWGWAFELTWPIVGIDMYRHPERWPRGSSSTPYYQDAYLVNSGIGGTAANEIHNLTQEVQRLGQELENMRYSRY